MQCLSMQGDNANIVIYVGSDYVKPLVFTDENGEPLNITDYTIYFIVKRSRRDSDDDVVISKAITNHTVPIEGESQISIPASETAVVSPGIYYWDMFLKRKDDTISEEILTGAASFKKKLLTPTA